MHRVVFDLLVLLAVDVLVAELGAVGQWRRRNHRHALRHHLARFHGAGDAGRLGLDPGRRTIGHIGVHFLVQHLLLHERLDRFGRGLLLGVARGVIIGRTAGGQCQGQAGAETGEQGLADQGGEVGHDGGLLGRKVHSLR